MVPPHRLLAALSFLVAASLGLSSLTAQTIAPGGPGGTPYWTRADKQGVGTSMTVASHVWFTVGNGTLNEVYYPAVDKANTRNLELIITDGSTFTDFEGVDTLHAVEYPDKNALVVRQVNTAKSGRYRITKTYITDPERDVVLINLELKVLKSGPALTAYVSYDPSLNNSGLHDTGFTHGAALIVTKQQADLKDKGVETPVAGTAGATPGDVSSALLAAPAFAATSSGFFESSDGSADLRLHRALTQRYDRAEDGNVVQVAQLAPGFGKGKPVTLALAFGSTAEAALKAGESSLKTPFAASAQRYAEGWHEYVAPLKLPESQYRDEFIRSAMVLRAHEDKLHPGAIVASITIPWGEGTDSKTPNVGGYHLVWARDLYEVATAFIAMGDTGTATRALNYLLDTQQKPDGSFPQNSWLTGEPYWGSLQMDEVAYPIVLAWQLGRTDLETYRKHLKPAAEFLVAKGPWSPQERWEEQDGYSPSTIAAEIAGLVCAADIAAKAGDTAAASRYNQTADEWFHQLKGWTVTTTGRYAPLYYLRMSQHGRPDAGEKVTLKNGGGTWDERDIVDAGFLELVRLGIVRPGDPTIAASLAVTDKVIKVDTPTGPGWYRYNHDGYGETADGKGYSGAGTGRLWPLFAGERGEYEIANGRDGRFYLDTMVKQANPGGMLAEQIWDRTEVPSPILSFGHASGSADPLAWATAQFIRLAMAEKEHRVVEMPSIVRDHFTSMQ